MKIIKEQGRQLELISSGEDNLFLKRKEMLNHFVEASCNKISELNEKNDFDNLTQINW